MYTLKTDKNNIIVYATDGIKSIVEMIIEHFIPKIEESNKRTIILVNVAVNAKTFRGSYDRIIYFNLEHKYPLVDKFPANSTVHWEKGFIRDCLNHVDEIWDFNIENYQYFMEHGLDDKFIFVPLRYTKWFEQFRLDINPRFELQFEGVFDTPFRLYCIRDLTTPGMYGDVQPISLKITNTPVPKDKFFEKQDCIFCLDLPHYDTPETINAVRIYENTCINKQTIVYDKYNVGSRAYFGNMVIYMPKLNVVALAEIVRGKYQTDVAEVFKYMTYSDDMYQDYRKMIKKDFEKISGTNIPDSVLRQI